MLLWSCDNVKNSQVYLKYPYSTYMLTMPLSWYLFFVNPFMWKWQVTLSIFYAANCFAWMPLAGGWTNHRDLPAPEPGGRIFARVATRRGTCIIAIGSDMRVTPCSRSRGSSPDTSA